MDPGRRHVRRAGGPRRRPRPAARRRRHIRPGPRRPDAVDGDALPRGVHEVRTVRGRTLGPRPVDLPRELRPRRAGRHDANGAARRGLRPAPGGRRGDPGFLRDDPGREATVHGPHVAVDRRRLLPLDAHIRRRRRRRGRDRDGGQVGTRRVGRSGRREELPLCRELARPGLQRRCDLHARGRGFGAHGRREGGGRSR